MGLALFRLQPYSQLGGHLLPKQNNVRDHAVGKESDQNWGTDENVPIKTKAADLLHTKRETDVVLPVQVDDDKNHSRVAKLSEEGGGHGVTSLTAPALPELELCRAPDR